MKITVNDKNDIIIYLNKIFLLNNKIVNVNNLEEYLYKFLNKYKRSYELNLNGYYNARIFNNDYYGNIILIQKQSLDFFNIFDGIELDIIIEKNCVFLYELVDIIKDNKILNKNLIYYYNGKFYLKIINEISNIEMGKIIEHSNIIYGDIVKKVINEGKIVYGI